MILTDAGIKQFMELSLSVQNLNFFLIKKLVIFLLLPPQNLFFIKEKGKEKVMCSSRLQNTIARSPSALTKTISVHWFYGCAHTYL